MEIGDIVRLKDTKQGSDAYILRGKIKQWMNELQRMTFSGYTSSSYQTYTTGGAYYNQQPLQPSGIMGTALGNYWGGVIGGQYLSTVQTIGTGSTGATYPSTYSNYGSIGDDVWMLDSIGEEEQYLLRPESDLEVDVFLTEVHKLKNSMKPKPEEEPEPVSA